MKNSDAINRHANKEKLLTAIFTLCGLDPSLSQEDLDALIVRSRRLADKRVRQLKPGRKGTIDLDALGHVVYRWQRSSKYLDKEGRPLRLKARGRAPSVESLFRETGHDNYFKVGIEHLREVGRVKRTRNGLYFPCAEVSIVQTLSPELVELLAQTINRVVATVLHNTSLSNKKAVRLIERVTVVPDLPKREVPAFKLFAREQGGALIDTLNDWLERRRGEQVRRRAGETGRLTAGLHVFAFIERNAR